VLGVQGGCRGGGVPWGVGKARKGGGAPGGGGLGRGGGESGGMKEGVKYGEPASCKGS